MTQTLTYQKMGTTALRASLATTAIAVARAAADGGVATWKTDDLVQAVQDAIWQPVHPDSVS